MFFFYKKVLSDALYIRDPICNVLLLLLLFEGLFFLHELCNRGGKKSHRVDLYIYFIAALEIPMSYNAAGQVRGDWLVLQCVDVVDQVACPSGVRRACLEAFLSQRFATLGSKAFLFLLPFQLGK